MLATKTDSLGRSQRWRMTLSAAITEFIERGVRSPATAKAYRSDLMLFVRWLAGHAGAGYDSVTRFTPEHLDAYLAELRALNKKPSTRHRRLAVFRKFSRWGTIHGLWKSDPTARIEAIPKVQRLPNPFTDDESARLLALALPAKENAMRAVLFFSGLRATAACSIRVKDVSAAPPRITYIAKGGKEKAVAMNAGLKDVLWDYISTHTDLRGETLIFRKKSGRPYDAEDLGGITKAWGERAGVPACRPHRFRHSFGTKLWEVTRDIRLVKDALGHDNIESTMIYTKVVDRHIEDGVNKLAWNSNNPTTGGE
jgi:site-specific recombinase XerD